MDSYCNILFMKQVAPAAALIMSFFLLLHSPNSQTNALILNSPTSLVDGVCKETINYADCVSTLNHDHRTPSASDLKTLAKISLEIAVANTTDSKIFIQKLADSKSTQPSLVQALKQCVTAYEGSVASFNSAKMELDEDISSANYDAKVAGDGAGVCEAALSSAKSDEQSVKARNYYVRLNSNIGFVITNHLDG